MGCKQTNSKAQPITIKENKTDKTGENNLARGLEAKNMSPICSFLSQPGMNSINLYTQISHLGRPHFDPFELVIFDIHTKNLTIDSKLKEPRLNEFDYLSSFCNGKNKLFISGGQESNAFSTIDLKEKTVEFVPMKSNRKSHSMIYIPDDFILIVGGVNDKSVECFNMTKKEITYHSQLNEHRIEPALCMVNNSYLYAFTGFKSDRRTFERINLASNATLWDTINVNSETANRGSISGLGNFTFGQNFFAVAHYRENEVIFLGGNDMEKKTTHSEKNYIFNYQKNLLTVSDLPVVNEEFTEKFFTPVDLNGDKISILFSNFRRNHPKLMVFSELHLKEVKFGFDS